jgi:hypothetical protein
MRACRSHLEVRKAEPIGLSGIAHIRAHGSGISIPWKPPGPVTFLAIRDGISAPKKHRTGCGRVRVPSVGQHRFYTRECMRWAEASTDELIREALLDVASIWAVYAVNEQVPLRPQRAELNSHSSVGFSRSSGPIYMRRKRSNQKKPQEPAALARQNYAGGRVPLPDDLRRRSSERVIAWSLAGAAIVMIAVIIGWDWVVAGGGGWGHSNRFAQMIAPASGPTDGPATRARNPPSNGHMR